jgi:hypothetical protein
VGLHTVPDRDRHLPDNTGLLVSRQSVSKRAKDRGWARDLAADVAIATGEKLTGLTSAASPAQRSAVVSAMSNDRASLIQIHREGWSDIYGLNIAAMMVMRGEPSIYSRDFRKHPPKTKDIQGRDISGEPILDSKGQIQWYDPVLSPDKRVALATKLTLLMKERSTSLQTAQEGQRRANGFDYKMQQDKQDEDMEASRRRDELIDEILKYVDTTRHGHIATNDQAKVIG